MELKRLWVAAIAAVFAISGIASILIQQQPGAVDAVDVSDDRDPALRREADDAPALEVVDDDDRGDGDDTAGDDGTSGGDNTGGSTNTGDATGGGDTTD
jgi:hypothetical protein